MVTSQQALKKYGQPSQSNPNLVLWDVPSELEIGVIPKRIYCNKDMVAPLTAAFKALISTGCVTELKTWDGCFNIRKKRGTYVIKRYCMLYYSFAEYYNTYKF